MLIEDKAYHLSKIDLFSALTNQELVELAEDFKWEEYTRGSDIIIQGQKRHLFYVLIEGEAEVLVNNKGHGLLQVSSFGSGDTFGEISLFTGNPAPTTVRSIKGCKVLVLDSEHFASMLIRWPKLYKRFIEELSHRLKKVKIGLWEARHKELLLSGLRLNQYQYKFYGLWGSPKTTREVENKLAELSENSEPLLLVGERGTGRQMLAWYLHKRQFGESAPFIVVDGRNFNHQWGNLMFESFVKGDSPTIKGNGILNLAEGGTLFIREVNLISPAAQHKLAKVLQSGEIKCRISGSLKAYPEFLSQQLVPELKECFTQNYKITPLRKRKKDISIIAQGILEQLARRYDRKPPALNKEAVKLLLSHHYRHGNVTELIQVIERAFFLAEEDVIGLEHLFYGPTAKKIGRSINLLSFNTIERLINKGVFPNWIQRIFTIIFILITILVFLAPKANTTIILFILIWGLWWPALTICSPFLGRVWCGVCPFSCIMEWVQKYLHMNHPVPNLLKKYDYLFVAFLFLLVFWVEAITGMRYNPLYTRLWLVCILAFASVIGIIFVRNTWCHHLCPLGGFVGMASVGGLLEVRADATVCLNKCSTYDCYRGKGNVSGCPMFQYAPFVDNNLVCKLCLRCVRNCPNGAIKVNLRVPAREVWHLVRVKQGFVVFIGIALAILIPINYFEPLHNIWPINKWRLWFSLSYWGTAIIGGVLTWLIARPFRTKAASRRIKLVFALIPMILAGYIIYQLRFLPGISSFMFGLIHKSSGDDILAFYVPVLFIGQVIAVVIGLFQTGFTIIMVLIRTRQKGNLENRNI